MPEARERTTVVPCDGDIVLTCEGITCVVTVAMAKDLLSNETTRADVRRAIQSIEGD